MDSTANLSLPYILPSQAQKHVTHNEALTLLDALVQMSVTSRSVSSPPAEPVPGQRFIVASAASGDWTGRGDAIALLDNGGWTFLSPKPGWRAFVADEGGFVFWDGTLWVAERLSVDELQNVPRLGIGTTADAVNPFAAKIGKALWTAPTVAEGGSGDLRYTLNKEGAANVLSLLFQSGYSGRAELGLAGSDDLAIRTSQDGVNWTEQMRFDRVAGETVVAGLRVGRDLAQNLLPDSGRFNGNGNNAVFSGIGWAAPSYISAIGGSTIAAHAKFIHNNNDYGGSAGTLDTDVRQLIDKIRAANNRRYGPEWFAMRMTQAATPSIEPQTIGGTGYGLICTVASVALPDKFTVGYFLKVRSGSAAIRLNSVRVMRASVDGVAMAAGIGASPLVLGSGDGWKYVGFHSTPNQYNYDNTLLQLLASANADILIAMPRIVFGHVDLNPAGGVLMNARLFG
jgi:hypothetical protein